MLLKRPDFGKQLQNSLKSSFVGDRSVPFNKSNAADWRASHHAVSHGFFYGYLPQKQAAVDVSAATAANQGPCSDPSLGPRFRCFHVDCMRFAPTHCRCKVTESVPAAPVSSDGGCGPTQDSLTMISSQKKMDYNKKKLLPQESCGPPMEGWVWTSITQGCFGILTMTPGNGDPRSFQVKQESLRWCFYGDEYSRGRIR